MGRRSIEPNAGSSINSWSWDVDNGGIYDFGPDVPTDAALARRRLHGDPQGDQHERLDGHRRPDRRRQGLATGARHRLPRGCGAAPGMLGRRGHDQFHGHATDARGWRQSRPRAPLDPDHAHCTERRPARGHGTNQVDHRGSATGSFTAPDHEYPSRLQLMLSVTDNQGALASTSVEIWPETSTVHLASVPTGRLDHRQLRGRRCRAVDRNGHQGRDRHSQRRSPHAPSAARATGSAPGPTRTRASATSRPPWTEPDGDVCSGRDRQLLSSATPSPRTRGMTRPLEWERGRRLVRVPHRAPAARRDPGREPADQPQGRTLQGLLDQACKRERTWTQRRCHSSHAFGRDVSGARHVAEQRLEREPLQDPLPAKVASSPPQPGSSWRSANSTFAGRSASRRMYHGYHAAP